MRNEFQDLIAFLDQAATEVSGRNHELPGGELREKLERFAEGTCSEAERLEICELIRNDPASIKWLADRVKEKRGNQAP